MLSTFLKFATFSCLASAVFAADFMPEEIEYQTLKTRVCPADMVPVKGMALPSSSDIVEILQDATCDDWISTIFPARCARFNQDKWSKARGGLKRHAMDFCMDIYEWPNMVNIEPRVFIDWYSAKRTCENAGKRLCNEEEWTFACEGEEGLPYPYGYERDPAACNIDHKWIAPDYDVLMNSSKAANELKRLWQGVPSGSMERCASPFGVHDMTGNVDEWTISTRVKGYRSVLKGGYWSVVRNRCRPSTRIHFEGYSNYQQGFRCCSNIK